MAHNETQGFNEAPINRPGKCRDPAAASARCAGASMRPRSIDRGNAHPL